MRCRHNTYSRDPDRLTARYDSPCARHGCTRGVRRGDSAFYYPSTRSTYCAEHAEAAELEFRSAVADEEGWGFAT